MTTPTANQDSTKPPSWPRCIRRAIQEIYWAIIPLSALLLVLTIFQQAGKVADMPDMMILASMLFGESAHKAHHLPSADQDEINGIYLFGMLAFVLSVSLWIVILIIDHGNAPELKLQIDGVFFYRACGVMWLLSFFYAIYVRAHIHRGTNTSTTPMQAKQA